MARRAWRASRRPGRGSTKRRGTPKPTISNASPWCLRFSEHLPKWPAIEKFRLHKNGRSREDPMTFKTTRRRFVAGASAAAGVAVFPMPSIAQSAPLKIGLLTVKTGPLAAGGIHFEEGITSFLKDKNFTLSGRKIDLIVADTGGNPAGAKTKAQEVVERDKVDIVLGPFAAFELLATVDYLAQAKMPKLAFAGAEDVTQRKAGPYLTRTSYTSAQCLYPLADYVFNEMKLKRAASMGDDFAFGYEQVGGF